MKPGEPEMKGAGTRLSAGFRSVAEELQSNLRFGNSSWGQGVLEVCSCWGSEHKFGVGM